MLRQGVFCPRSSLIRPQEWVYNIHRPLNTTNVINDGTRPTHYNQRSSKPSVVISGISGRFPRSESVEELKQNLLHGTDMFTKQTRFTVGKQLPPKFGFLNNLEKFDADFFGVSDTMAHVMDPSIRKLMEVVFEAIVDAGINPETLKNTTTGVFVASDGADPLSYWNIKRGESMYDEYTLLGNPMFMLANQISHIFDLKGQSMTLTTGCSSSIHALESAVSAIMEDKCERAIVAATTLHLSSRKASDINALVPGALSPTSVCKPFDKSANGYVRSEAVVSVLIEKQESAKRSYAKILEVRCGHDGLKKEGIFHLSGSHHSQFYEKVYSEAGIDPGSVDYIQTHGMGTIPVDRQELEGIFETFCRSTPNRTKPLLIGSMKSKMGHSEAASGLCNLAKIIISAQEGVIPSTCNFIHEPSETLELFQDSIQLVTKNTPFLGGIVATTSFGLGGTIGHVILDTKVNDANKTMDSKIKMSKNQTESSQILEKLPVLIPFSGREEETLRKSIINACNLAHSNPDFAALIQNVYKENIHGYAFRGYGILPVDGLHPTSNPTFKSKTFLASNCAPSNIVCNIKNYKSNGSTNRPVWFVFPGIGSQWQGMGKELMRIGAFQESYRRSRTTFKNSGVDLDALLLPNNNSILENIRDAYNAIAAMQIALLDTLDSIGIKADGFFGHSFGEILCAYSDNCITAEEALLTVDANGRAMLQQEMNKDSSPGAMTLYLNSMQEILNGKIETKRSNRWISSSIPESERNSNLAQNASPEYFFNNFVNPVLFDQAISHVPNNAILIEIAPQGVLQKGLKASLPDTCSILAPMQEKTWDRMLHFLTCIGDIYNAGVDVDISALYPPVRFPVSAQTPSISPLIKWKHDKSWIVPIIENTKKYTDSVLNLDFQDPSFSFLEGHKLEDCLVFPATAYLVFAWKRFAASLGRDFEELPVQFTNVCIKRNIILSHNKAIQLRCSFHPGQGTFEIHENGSSVACGRITRFENDLIAKISIQKDWKEIKPSNDHERDVSENNICLKSEDVYKELAYSGYNFSGNFKSIKRMNLNLKESWAETEWNGNWTTFLDSILQVCVMGKHTHRRRRATYIPVSIASLRINPLELYAFSQQDHSEKDSLPVHNQIHLNVAEAPGIEMKSVIYQQLVPKRSQDENTLAITQYQFTPYIQQENVSTTLHSPLAAMVDIYLENSPKKKHITIYDTFTKPQKPSSVKKIISEIFATQHPPLHEASIISTFGEKTNLLLDESSFWSFFHDGKETTFDQCIAAHTDGDLVLLDDASFLNPISKLLKDNAWIILHDNEDHQVKEERNSSKLASIDNDFKAINLKLISKATIDGKELTLFRKMQSIQLGKIQQFSIDGEVVDCWLPRLKELLANSNSNPGKIYVYSQKKPVSGMVELIKSLMNSEPGGERLRCLFDPEGKIYIDFDNPNTKLAKVIAKDLVMNVIENGCYGSYRNVPLDMEVLKEPTKVVNHAKVTNLLLGDQDQDFSGLQWEESPLKYSKENNLINVNYATLNVRDISVASSRNPFLTIEEDYNSTKNKLVLEFSGTDLKGNRLMGMGLRDSHVATSFLPNNNNLVWKIPEKWSMEDAATVPRAYSTAYYSLFMRGNLESGQSILIHSGTTGGVGQAAINLALSMNCEVFTTVGTEDERKHILQLFPMLKQENIISSSKSLEVEQSIFKNTKGKGVDFVLNSLSESGDKLQASFRCLASDGTFLQIGEEFKVYKDTLLGVRNINFSAINLNKIFSNDHGAMSRVHELVQEGIASGVVKPLERKIFRKDEVQEAFRFMARGNHTGLALIQVKQEEDKETTTVLAVPKTYFDPEKVFLIVDDGLGGFGLELADWMIQKGAKHLILTISSISGVPKGYQRLCLKRWAHLDVKVEIRKIDLSCYDTARMFLKDIGLKEEKILGGFFHSELVVMDSVPENQTEEMYEKGTKPKYIQLTENMDKLTRELRMDLDYFVTLSNIPASLGNAGQNYDGFANRIGMEQICLQRRKDGLHAAAIQWGVTGDDENVPENMNDDPQVFDGMLPQKVSSSLDVLDSFLEQSTNGGGTFFCFNGC